RGRGSFAGQGKVRITAGDGTTQEVSASHIVIATGSKPIEIPPAKFDRELIVSSTGALKFDKVPKNLLEIGGGIIGLEMGSVWSRLGAKVTVIEATDRLIPGMDGDLAKELLKILKKQGMEFHLKTKLIESAKTKTQVKAICETADGE